jgi:hypothetical protein
VFVIRWKRDQEEPIKRIQTAFQTARARAKFSPAITPYSIRHTVAVELRKRGVPMADRGTARYASRKRAVHLCGGAFGSDEASRTSTTDEPSTVSHSRSQAPCSSIRSVDIARRRWDFTVPSAICVLAAISW